jgi:hypothetical protein
MSRSPPLQFKLSKVQSLTDVPKAADAILQAVSTGQLTPEEGEQVMKLLKEYREILILADIVPRLEILEQR